MISKFILRQFLPLILWYLFTLYSIIYIGFSELIFTNHHFINFVLLSLVTIFHIFKTSLGHLITLIMLILGFFIKASFVPSFIAIGYKQYEFSLPYLLLLLLYISLNIVYLKDWYDENLD